MSFDEAQRIVAEIVTRTVPIIQEFDGGDLKVLNTSLTAKDYCLVLLHRVRPPMRANLSRTLRQIEDGSVYIHSIGENFQITQAGDREIEKRRLVEF